MVKKLLITLFAIILTACSGGSGVDNKKVDPLLINPETSCGIKFVTLERPEIEKNYVDSISGIISGVSVFIKDGSGIIIWGNGSVLKWGTISSQFGHATVPNSDTITTIVKGKDSDVIFGTNNGIGIAGFDGAEFKVKQYKELENGILNGINAPDGYVYFINSAGQIIRTTDGQIIEGKCVDLVRNYSSWASGQNWYPTKMAANAEKLVVVLQNSGPIPALTTGVEPAIPILKEIYSGNSMHQLKIVGTDVGSDDLITMEFEARRSSFIPTGLAFDGGDLLVAGLAFDASNAKVFAETNCGSEANKLDCLWNLALTGDLQKNKIGDYAVFSNRLIKIDPNTSEIERTQEIYIEQYGFSPAPPLISLVAFDGTLTHVRGSSYYLMLAKNDRAGWTVSHGFGSNIGDVTIGWPRQLVSDVSGGAVASLISPVKSSAPSYSTLEHINSSGSRSMVDQASSETKIVDYVDNKYIMIPRVGIIGGKLYIKESDSSYFLNPSTDPDKTTSHYKYYIVNATYDSANSKLAYSWGGALSDNTNIKINIQSGLSASTVPKNDLAITRTEEKSGPFIGFPPYVASDPIKIANSKRGIADMKFNKGKLYLLFYGYENSKHYFRIGEYTLTGNILTDEKKVTNLLTVNATSSAFKSAKILKFGDDETIYFSTPKGIYSSKTKADPSIAGNEFSIVDIAVKDDNASILSTDKVYYMNLASLTTSSSAISSSTTNGTTALLTSHIFTSLPSTNTVTSYTLTPSPLSSYEVEGSVFSLPASENTLYFVNKYGLIGRYNF